MGNDKLFVKFCIYLISTFNADYICIPFFIVLCICFTCTAVDFDRFTYTVYLGRKFMYEFYFNPLHYIDVIMTTMASQITSLTVVYSTVYSDRDQRKHQSSTSLAFVWGIHRTKSQLRGKCFHLMTSSWTVTSSYNLVPCIFVDIGPGYVLLSKDTKS